VVQCTAQNLIPNYSFEDTSRTGWSFSLPDKWNLASGINSQPEYYNEYHDNLWTIPENFFGFQHPIFGTKYIGLKMYYFEDFAIKQRDYIPAQLIQTLKTDTNYCFKIHVNLPDSMRYASRNQLGIYFSNSRVSSTSNFNLPYTPQIIVSPTDYISEKENWSVFNHTYKASGGERYLVMGNFNDTTAIDTLFLGNKTENINYNGTYYFIDNLYLGSCDSLPISYDGSVQTKFENTRCYTNNSTISVNYTNEGEEWLDFTEDTLSITAEVRRNGALMQTITQEITTNSLNPITNHPLIGGTTAEFLLQNLDFSTIGATYNLKVTASFVKDEVAANNIFDTTFTTNQQIGFFSISDDTICSGEEVQLYSSANIGTAKWQFSDDLSTWQNLPVGDSAVHTPTSNPTFYRLAVCDVLYSDTFQVVNPIEIILADTAFNGCKNTSLTITPLVTAPIQELNWYSSPSAETPFYQGFTYSFTISQNQTFYLATVVDSCESTTRSEVKITADKCELFIPNVFSPNGDGLNDTWEFQNVNNRSLNVTIFTRWGAEIANWKDNQPWDGGNLENGVYYYIIETSEQTYRGTVSVLR
tara:strand:+ start:1503 stop:3257 length:1755 start_codon:yes stop_codon:yes gene_type:complete